MIENRVYTSLSDHRMNLFGIYRCRVENNKDPLGIGRVQVRVPMIQGIDMAGISSESLPWASMCSNNGAGYNFGSFVTPEIGEYGFVMFEDGDSNKPVFLGSTFGTGTIGTKVYGDSSDPKNTWRGVAGANEVPMESQRENPTHKMLYKSRLGSKIYFDTDVQTENITIEDEHGQYFKISSMEGNHFITIMGEQGVNLTIKDGQVFIGNDASNIKVTTKDNDIKLTNNKSTITLNNSGKVQIDSSNTEIKSSKVNIASSNVKVNAKNLKMRGKDINITESNPSLKGSLSSNIADYYTKNGITPTTAVDYLKTSPLKDDIAEDYDYFNRVLSMGSNESYMKILDIPKYKNAISNVLDSLQGNTSSLDSLLSSSLRSLGLVFDNKKVTELFSSGVSLEDIYALLNKQESYYKDYGKSPAGISYDSKDIAYLILNGLTEGQAKEYLNAMEKYKINPNMGL